MIPSGETWGISGPTFLLAYVRAGGRRHRGRRPGAARPHRYLRGAAREPAGRAAVRRGVPQRRRRARGHRGAQRHVPDRNDQHGRTGRRRRGSATRVAGGRARTGHPPRCGVTGVAAAAGRGGRGGVGPAPHRAAADLGRARPERGAPPADPAPGRVGAGGGRPRRRPGHGRFRQRPSGRVSDHRGRAGLRRGPAARRHRAAAHHGGRRAAAPARQPTTTCCRRPCGPTGTSTARPAPRSRWGSSGSAPCGPRTRRSPPNWRRSVQRPPGSAAVAAPAAAIGGGELRRRRWWLRRRRLRWLSGDSRRRVRRGRHRLAAGDRRVRRRPARPAASSR